MPFYLNLFSLKTASSCFVHDMFHCYFVRLPDVYWHFFLKAIGNHLQRQTSFWNFLLLFVSFFLGDFPSSPLAPVFAIYLSWTQVKSVQSHCNQPEGTFPLFFLSHSLGCMFLASLWKDSGSEEDQPQQSTWGWIAMVAQFFTMTGSRSHSNGDGLRKLWSICLFFWRPLFNETKLWYAMMIRSTGFLGLNVNTTVYYCM